MGIFRLISSIVEADTEAKKRQAQLEMQEIEKQRRIAQEQELTRRAIAREAEITKRNIAMQEAEQKKIIAAQEAIARHKQELEGIRQKRIDNPINIICPRCTAPRNISRMEGTITCPYCNFKEPLPDFHLYNRELDEVRPSQPVYNNPPAQSTVQRFAQNINEKVPQTQSKIDVCILISLILSVVSFLLCCGIFIIPEVIGLIFAIVPFLNKNKKLSIANIVLAVVAITLNGALLLFAIFGYSSAILDKTKNGTSTNNSYSTNSYSSYSDYNYETETDEATEASETDDETATVSAE